MRCERGELGRVRRVRAKDRQGVRQPPVAECSPSSGMPQMVMRNAVRLVWLALALASEEIGICLLEHTRIGRGRRGVEMDRPRGCLRQMRFELPQLRRAVAALQLARRRGELAGVPAALRAGRIPPTALRAHRLLPER